MSKFVNDFQKDMEAHLVAFKENEQYLPAPSQRKKCFYSELSDNLFPPIKHGFLNYMSNNGMPLHDFVNHVRSSQVYCINVLFSMISLNPNALLKVLGDKIGKELSKIVHFEFEYSPEKNILGEWKSDANRPDDYVTAVDLRLDVAGNAGQEITFLIEVKFTEDGFSECGGYNSGANVGSYKQVCLDSSVLLRDYKLCYLNGAKLHRKYFDKDFNPADSFKNEFFQKECPFRFNHQTMRNHTLARKIGSSGSVYFVLLYHESNQSIKNHWDDYRKWVKDESDLIELTGKELVDHSGNETLQKYYKDRYTI